MGYRIRMRFPEGKRKAFTLSYDDGMTSDFRLAEIMRKNGIKGTFNVNTGCFQAEDFEDPPEKHRRRMKKSEMLAFYEQYKDVAEMAVHTVTHPTLNTLPTGSVTWEVAQDRHNIEELFGVVCRGMAYPDGAYTDETVKALEVCGIAYARTTKSAGFDLPTDWLRMPATCHHTIPNLQELGEEFLNLKLDTYRDTAKWFYLWGHTYEFDDNNDWEKIERFLEQMGGKPEIWYATNIEIYDYIKAFESLQFSVDGKRVFNPTCRPVWFAVYRKYLKAPADEYCVNPGETITL